MVERTTAETYGTTPKERYNSLCELEEMSEGKNSTHQADAVVAQDKAVVEDRNGRGRFVKGNKAAQVHGAYEIKARGELPFTEEREKIGKHLDRLRLNLEKQFGKDDGKKDILIGQILTHEAIIEHLKLYLYKIGSPVDMYRRGKRDIAEAQPCVRDLLQHMTAQRHALKELEAEAGGQKTQTLTEVVKEIEEEEESEE